MRRRCADAEADVRATRRHRRRDGGVRELLGRVAGERRRARCRARASSRSNSRRVPEPGCRLTIVSRFATTSSMPRTRRGLPRGTISPCARVRKRSTQSRLAVELRQQRLARLTRRRRRGSRRRARGRTRTASRLSALPWNSSAMPCAIRQRSAAVRARCRGSRDPEHRLRSLDRRRARELGTSMSRMLPASSDPAAWLAASHRRASGVSDAPAAARKRRDRCAERRARHRRASPTPCDRGSPSRARPPPASRARRSPRRSAAGARRCVAVASRPPSIRHATVGFSTLIRQILAYMTAGARPLTIRCPARRPTSARCIAACSTPILPSRAAISMTTVGPAFEQALALIARGDANLFSIIGLSLRVSLSAVLLASLVALSRRRGARRDELSGAAGADRRRSMRCSGCPPSSRASRSTCCCRAPARSARSASCSRRPRW